MKKNIERFETVGEKRYRETQGLYYEEFEVGDVFEHRPGRTITETDNIWMSLLCLNNHPLHINEHYGQQTEFGRTLVSSLITFSLVGGMSLQSTSAKAIANLGWDKVKLHAPVYVGDTIYAETTVLHKRESKSRPTQGIVTVETRGLKADQVLFLSYQRSFLVPKKSYPNPLANY